MRKLAFAATWLNRFGLPKTGWRSKVTVHLKALPFVDSTEARPLIEFLFGKVPKILAKDDDQNVGLLAEAFAWCCYAFWQCGSAFPAFPENYAIYLRKALTAQTPDQVAIFLAKMLVEFNAKEGRCGFNRLELADAGLIRESEALVHEGRYEFYLRAQEKYEEYFFYLEQSEEFRKEWALLKETFPTAIVGKKVINRSLMPERNWVRGPGAIFDGEAKRFQALFDLFCWKYFLWGMEGDRPLLLKTSVVFTPYGTQLFIPGYLSLDPKRDLDFSKVTRLHRARGIARQGPGFSSGRRELADLQFRARNADRDARRKGLKGDNRYNYICKIIGYRDECDYRRLRKLLQTR